LRRCEALYRQASLMHGRSWSVPASPRPAALLPDETDQV